MGVPIVAGIGSQKSKYGNLSFPITVIAGASFNAYNTFNLTPTKFDVGPNILYQTEAGGGGQPNLYNLTLTFDNTQLLANATLFENATLYPFNISISSALTPTEVGEDDVIFGGVYDRNNDSTEAQLIATLTSGLNKSVFLDGGGTFSVSVPFGEGSAGDWIMQGRPKLGPINTQFGLGFLVNDNSRNPQNLPTRIQFVANLTNDLGIVCQSKATMFIKYDRIGLEQPPPSQPFFNSLQFITLTYGANQSTEVGISGAERIQSIANTGNGFILPVATGSTGVAADYSSAANTQVNHELVMDYDATNVDASQFPDFVQGRLVVQTDTANLGLYNRTDPGSYYSPSTNQVYTFTNLYPKEEVLAPEPSINFSVLFEEDQAFRFVSGVNTTFTIQIEWQKNDGSYLSSIPQTVTVNDNAVVPTMT